MTGSPTSTGRRPGRPRRRLWTPALLVGLTLIGLSAILDAPLVAGGRSEGLGQRRDGAVVISTRSPSEEPVERLRVEVLDTLPHDHRAFTQGLLWHNGELIESTGLYGESTLRRVAVDSGMVLGQRRLDDNLFGEGLARVDDRLIQLTWREGRALVWSIDGLKMIDEFAYDGEGWGLCYDGATLFMSDGSSRLTLRDPHSFASRGQLTVSLEGRPVDGLNELECAEGWIYANVYGTRQIVRLDPSSGRVTAVINAGALPQEAGAEVDVMNGIAYRPDRGTFLLTGKKWPTLFEVVFVPAHSP